jgi:hypothetical protein
MNPEATAAESPKISSWKREAWQPCPEALLDHHVQQCASDERPHDRLLEELEHLQEARLLRMLLDLVLVESGEPHEHKRDEGERGEKPVRVRPAAEADHEGEEKRPGHRADLEDALEVVHQSGMLGLRLRDQPDGRVDGRLHEGEADADGGIEDRRHPEPGDGEHRPPVSEAGHVRGEQE